MKCYLMEKKKLRIYSKWSENRNRFTSSSLTLRVSLVKRYFVLPNRQFNLNLSRTRREFIVAYFEWTSCIARAIPRRNGWFTADHVIKPRRRCNGKSSDAKE